MDEVDIILPTYNGEKFLREQIDSILNQTYKNFRLIVSDDCSKDSTAKLLKEYEEKDSRVKVFIQEENLGVVKNIEFLLKQVKAPIFMLADQDDFWLEEKVQKSVDALVNNRASLVFGDLEVVDSNLKTIYPSYNDYMLLSRKIKKYLGTNRFNYLYNCVTGCTICARSGIINYILPLPKNSKYVIHDYWIALLASVNGKVIYIPEKYIKYRQHGNNQVGTDKISHKFNKFEDVRNLFITVKKEIFIVYNDNIDKIPDELKKLTIDGLEYFKNIENKKYFNFKGWIVFHKLYKTERFMYYIENFLIFNMPFIGKILFNIRYFILKLRGKR